MRWEVARDEPPDWDERLKAAGGTIFHSTAWAAYVLAEQPDNSPIFLTGTASAGDVRAMALAFHSQSQRRLLAAVTGRVQLDSRPTCADEASERAMLDHVERVARDLGAVELSVGSFAAPDRVPSLESLGYTPTRRLEFEVHLQQADDALLRGMDVRRRQKIRKAQKSGVEIRSLDGDAGLYRFRELQTASSERIVQRGGPQIGFAGEPGDDPVRVLLDRGVAQLVGAFVDDDCVSAALFTHFGGLVYYAMSGHDARGFASQAPTQLLWETMRRYREAGITRFNLGGCGEDATREESPEHGVFMYKKSFGGACLNCTTGTRVLRPHMRRALDVIRGFHGRQD